MIGLLIEGGRGMKIGLFTLGLGAASHPDAIRDVAQTAERTGVATLWAAEHVVLFDRYDSAYPYSRSGAFPLGADADWLDPFVTLAFAAAVTSRIRLATGICLVPEHNPLILAKEVASLDRLAKGRFALGVGIGWSAEEFAALGIPFARRSARTREYVEVMRKLWSDGVATHHGEFVRFDDAGSFPKPAQGAKVPVIFGGESDPALRRVAEVGDGWYGFNLDPAGAKERIARLERFLARAGRALGDVELIVAPYTKQITVDDLGRYRDLGIGEVVLLATLPADPRAVTARVERFAREWVEPAARL
jgi:probable F420-dependent oxidoreductase